MSHSDRSRLAGRPMNNTALETRGRVADALRGLAAALTDRAAWRRATRRARLEGEWVARSPWFSVPHLILRNRFADGGARTRARWPVWMGLVRGGGAT